jgi:hypothetical protein
MNRIEFIKQNGGLGRTATTEDVISGLVMGLNGKITSADIPEFDVIFDQAPALQTLVDEHFSAAPLNSAISYDGNLNTGHAGSGEATTGAIILQLNKYCQVTLPTLSSLVIKTTANDPFNLTVKVKKGNESNFTTLAPLAIQSAAAVYNLHELYPAIISTADAVTVRFEQTVSGKELRIHDLAAVGNVPGNELLKVATLKFYNQLSEQYGVEEVAEPAEDLDFAKNAIVYHVREFFRMSPTGTLYLGIKTTGTVAGDEITGSDVKVLQKYSEGKIRQMGIFTSTLANIASYQQAASQLEAQHQPLSIAFTCNKGNLTAQTLATGASHVVAGRRNISMLVGCDLDVAVLAALGDTQFGYYGCIGNLLGTISAAAVNESIAWVGKFPLGLKAPGLITGELIREVDDEWQNLIDGNRYIFVRTHTGAADCYYNDSHTFDLITSDYAYIENNRTMDKAIRGIRSNLLPSLNAPLYVDAKTGKMNAATVKTLEVTAQRALEDMEKAGELSGYVVEIDPNQNVLATSAVEIVIKNVPVGVMRIVRVKIGYTTQI